MGIDEVLFSLSRSGSEVEKRFARTVLRNAKRLQLEASERAPKGETGRLSSTIVEDGGKLSREVGPTVSYARYVEFGTATHPPQPFMLPAFDKIEPKFVKELERDVERSL
jgi:HK97 gp10 family phage protein